MKLGIIEFYWQPNTTWFSKFLVITLSAFKKLLGTHFQVMQCWVGLHCKGYHFWTELLCSKLSIMISSSEFIINLKQNDFIWIQWKFLTCFRMNFSKNPYVNNMNYINVSVILILKRGIVVLQQLLYGVWFFFFFFFR